MWDRDEKKIILNSNSNPDGRGQDRTLVGGAGRQGLSQERQSPSSPPALSQGAGSALGSSTHRGLACHRGLPAGP